MIILNILLWPIVFLLDIIIFFLKLLSIDYFKSIEDILFFIKIFKSDYLIFINSFLYYYDYFKPEDLDYFF
jgi:hypothetical protein